MEIEDRKVNKISICFGRALCMKPVICYITSAIVNPKNSGT
jgi:hypothetical protein